MIRIIIIDDQKSVLQSLQSLIELEEELKVIGTAENGQQGIKLIEQLQPDVAIIDLNMPLKSGIETTYLTTQNYPRTKVLIFTSSDGGMLNKAILAGAKGYLLKNSSRENLIAAIHAVKRNSVYIGDGILDRVHLSSVDWQREKMKQIDSWLAKEVINWWSEHSLVSIPPAKKIVESLRLDRAGLSWMKDYLCWQEDANFTLREKISSKVKEFFIEIEDAANPEQKLIEKQPEILDWFERENQVDYLLALHNNSRLLQTTTSEKLEEIVSLLWQQTAPLPLLECLRSIENHLSNWQQSFEHESENNLVKENAARHSFNYLLESPDNNLFNKQELCQKAVMFIYQCKINAELDTLLAQLISKTIQQLKIHLEILDKTNNLLSEFKQQLEQQYTPDIIALTPFFEQLKEKVFLKELRGDLEQSMGHSLNQWGVSESITFSEINNCLMAKLRPIAQEIYSNLRKEALAISFLEYAEHGDASLRQLISEDEASADYWKI